MFIAGIGNEQGILEEILYDVDGRQLSEINVMLQSEKIASCWQEKLNGEVVETYYTIPTWYVRYKKLNEIL
jgi:hypothetical protein